MATTAETAALDRLLESVGRCLTRESAQRLIELQADPQLQSRLESLAEKSTESSLSAEERSEYETYVRAIDFITVLQSKARRALRSD